MKLREFAEQIGISYSTALRMFRRGEVPGAYKLPSGTIVIPDFSLTLISGNKIAIEEFFKMIDNLAKQKLKESDYKHVLDLISLSTHNQEDDK